MTLSSAGLQLDVSPGLLRWHALQSFVQLIPYACNRMTCPRLLVRKLAPAECSLCRLTRVEDERHFVPHASADEDSASKEISNGRVVIVGCYDLSARAEVMEMRAHPQLAFRPLLPSLVSGLSSSSRSLLDESQSSSREPRQSPSTVLGTFMSTCDLLLHSLLTVVPHKQIAERSVEVALRFECFYTNRKDCGGLKVGISCEDQASE